MGCGLEFGIQTYTIDRYSPGKHLKFTATCFINGGQSDTYDILLNVSAADTVASDSVKIVDGDQMYYFTEMSSLVWFVHCPAFHEYLKAYMETWKQDFFVMEKTDFLALILPLPFYRMAEPLQGEALMTKEQVPERMSISDKDEKNTVSKVFSFTSMGYTQDFSVSRQVVCFAYGEIMQKSPSWSTLFSSRNVSSHFLLNT